MRPPPRFGVVEICLIACLLAFLVFALRMALAATKSNPPVTAGIAFTTAPINPTPLLDVELGRLELKVVSMTRSNDMLTVRYAFQNSSKQPLEAVKDGERIRAVFFDSEEEIVGNKGEASLAFHPSFLQGATDSNENSLSVAIPPGARSVLLEATFQSGTLKRTIHTELLPIPGH